LLTENGFGNNLTLSAEQSFAECEKQFSNEMKFKTAVEELEGNEFFR
jgi:hypothetical protein